MLNSEARLSDPPKTPNNSSAPPSTGQKSNRADKSARNQPGKASLDRTRAGRELACEPDATVTAKLTRCLHCQSVLTDADQVLYARNDKVDLPPVRPVVTRIEHYAGHCRCCGGLSLAPVLEGTEQGSAVSISIVALTIYLRFTHAKTADSAAGS